MEAFYNINFCSVFWEGDDSREKESRKDHQRNQRLSRGRSRTRRTNINAGFDNHSMTFTNESKQKKPDGNSSRTDIILKPNEANKENCLVKNSKTKRQNYSELPWTKRYQKTGLTQPVETASKRNQIAVRKRRRQQNTSNTDNGNRNGEKISDTRAISVSTRTAQSSIENRDEWEVISIGATSVSTRTTQSSIETRDEGKVDKIYDMKASRQSGIPTSTLRLLKKIGFKSLKDRERRHLSLTN